MFYDAPKGLLSYLKNIKVSEPRLKIECSDDLQVHLTTKEEKKKVQNSKGIKKIIAIGAVKIDATVVDKKTGATRTLKGSAAVVEFDYVSGVTTFKGGFPSLHGQCPPILWRRPQGHRDRQPQGGREPGLQVRAQHQS